MAALYVECRSLLLYVAIRKFGVPDADAESLLHDAVLSLLTTSVPLENPRACLVAAVANASRAYLRSRARYDLVELSTLDAMTALGSTLDTEQVERELTLNSILLRLHPRYRDILRMHYLEQLTSSEIAARLGSTIRYTEKRIVVALRRVREAYGALKNRGNQYPERSQSHPVRSAGAGEIHTLDLRRHALSPSAMSACPPPTDAACAAKTADLHCPATTYIRNGRCTEI